MRIGGYMGKVLDVDLTSGRCRKYPLPDKMLETYVGSKALGARLLYEMLEPGVDAKSPDNVFIVTTAPMTATGAPSTNRFNITTKSPVTGTIVCSNSGGSFGYHMKRAGYDALIIRGKAPKPSWLNITENDVKIESASDLWGLDTEITQEKLPKKGGAMVIGPAGENQVAYACIVSQERVSGRAGVGAVMGSKNLKAVFASGNRRPWVRNPKEYKEVCKKWTEVLKKHPASGEDMPNYGTAGFINRVNVGNAMPTKNFMYGTFEKCDNVSGETLADKYLVKNDGCIGCPIRCGRVVEVDGKKVKGPEYEALALFGPNLMNDDITKVFEWNYICDLMGLDAISTPTTLGFAMELQEKGVAKTGVEFGKVDNISKVIEDIAYRRGFGDELANGVRWLSEKYGGKDYAMHVKGLEVPGYEPRGSVGHGLGYAIASRGACHLSGGYLIYMEVNGPVTVNPLSAKGKAGLVVLNQTILEAISSVGSCNFTAFSFVDPILIQLYNNSRIAAAIISGGFMYSGDLLGGFLKHSDKALPLMPPFVMFPHVKAHKLCTGMDFNLGKYFALGQRAFNMERLFNVREGFSIKDDTLPSRFTDELQRMDEPNSKVPLEQLRRKYYQLRGWDEEGRPKDSLLRELSIKR